MPDPIDTTGAGSSFKFGNPTTLIEVTGIKEWPELPTSEEKALIDVTHYKSPGFKKQYRNSPWQDGAEGNFVFKIEVGSDLDKACLAAKADGKSRPYEMILPKDDTAPTGAAWKITGTLLVRNYTRSNPMDGDVRQATLTVKWDGEGAEVAQGVTP